MTALNFFQSIFSFPIEENMVLSALVQRGIFDNEQIENLTPEEINLTIADILVMLSRASQGYLNKTGGTAFTLTVNGAAMSLKDRQAMRYEADAIYRKYNEIDKISRSRSAINI